MKTAARRSALGFLACSLAYYLWHGLTFQSTGELAWLGPQMVWPLVALPIAIVVFAFTGDSVLTAFTGRNSAAFRDGLVGIGTVTGVRPTGMTLNDQPQVRIDLSVEASDGEVFASHAKMIVPLTELALLQPGVVLPVRYLPGLTDKVEIDRSGDPSHAQAAYNQSMIRQGITTEAKLAVAEHGIPAQAVVQSLSVPGEIRNGNSKIALSLVVTRPDGTTFATRVEKFVPPRGVQHIQVGRVVEVRYLPEREDDVVLVVPVNV